MVTAAYSLAVAPALILLALVFVVLGVILLRNSYPAGVTALGLSMFGVALWVGGAGGEILADRSPIVFLIMRNVKYVGTSVIPPLFLVFVVRHALERRMPWLGVAALFVVPVLSVLLVWTNPLHELMYPHPPSPPVVGERTQWGPWFLAVHVPVLYAMMVMAWGILGMEMVRGTTLRRAQATVLFLGSAIPLAVNAVYVLDPDIPDLQFTSLSFAFTAVVFGWGFFRFRLFQVNPLALRAVFDAVGDAVLLVDGDGRVADANPVARRLLGADARGEILGKHVGLAMERAGLASELPSPAAPAEMLSRNHRHLEIEVHNVESRKGRDQRGMVVVLRDVTDRRRAEEALRESEAMMRSVVERAPIGIVRLRPVRDEGERIRDFSCVLANPTTRKYLARDGQDLIGRTLTEVRPPHTPLFIDTFRHVVGSREPAEFVVQVESETMGATRWFRLNAVPAGGDVSVMFVDITDERTRQMAMESAANHDTLTGLLNRRGLEEDGRIIVESAVRDGRQAGLLFMDLNHFKRVNDDHGHQAGDQILKTFADRLQDCVRAEDLVGRIGGDEFVVLVQEGNAARVQEVADRVRTVGRQPYYVDGQPLHSPPSVGAALLPRDGTTLEELLQVADQAMYRSKGRGEDTA